MNDQPRKHIWNSSANPGLPLPRDTPRRGGGEGHMTATAGSDLGDTQGATFEKAFISSWQKDKLLVLKSLEDPDLMAKGSLPR